MVNMSGILMMQKENNMDEIIRSIHHALDCAQNRLQWYSVVGEDKLMKESQEWMDIADMYMAQLITKENN
jgi:hypothetical protein